MAKKSKKNLKKKNNIVSNKNLTLGLFFILAVNLASYLFSRNIHAFSILLFIPYIGALICFIKDNITEKKLPKLFYSKIYILLLFYFTLYLFIHYLNLSYGLSHNLSLFICLFVYNLFLFKHSL